MTDVAGSSEVCPGGLEASSRRIAFDLGRPGIAQPVRRERVVLSWMRTCSWSRMAAASNHPASMVVTPRSYFEVGLRDGGGVDLGLQQKVIHGTLFRCQRRRTLETYEADRYYSNK